MKSILKGVEKTYQEKKLPFVHMDMPACSAYYLGNFMQLQMIQTMYLADLLKVNAFDQPAVESYKKETIAFLKKST
jgi:glucose-6-phosphate isomerase